jgi:tetratricopeptide (TPR) repeat protein
MSRPLCFVLMPFGKKPDAGGLMIDFDAVYKELIAPAIGEAGLEPIRADEEQAGGIIQKPMFERLILCEYAVADLTTANANVFYEMGVRHAVRPWTTAAIFFEKTARLPFDVAEAAADKPLADSPIFQLLDGYPDITSDKTDVFRKQVRYSSEIKARLETARREGVDAVRAMGLELSRTEDGQPDGLMDLESGVIIDLFLSYRAVKAWEDMLALVDKMPRPLAATVLVREQYALALNRAGQREHAEKVLTDLIARRGPSSETYGILGRVYKDRWEAALKDGNKLAARGFLDKAIDAYRKGFETDWRDAYPGINAVTLMEIKESPDSKRHELIPVVSYAVERRIASGQPDYWDHATRLELAVLAKDEQKATNAAGDALASVREPWEPETTVRNLRLIREARERRHDEVPWAKEIEDDLLRKAKEMEKALKGEEKG